MRLGPYPTETRARIEHTLYGIWVASGAETDHRQRNYLDFSI
jgi:hypothetical protein